MRSFKVKDYGTELILREITPRERDTILAALRHWQNTMHKADPEIRDIADNENPGSALDVNEIDELCEHINLGDVIR